MRMLQHWWWSILLALCFICISANAFLWPNPCPSTPRQHKIGEASDASSSKSINIFNPKSRSARVNHQAVALPEIISDGSLSQGVVVEEEKEGLDSKDALFEALQSHTRRKEAFEELWNSDIDFSADEYQDLIKACFRLGYGKSMMMDNDG